MDHLQLSKVSQFITVALECSYYVSPDDPGLSYQELFQVVGRLGIKDGQISDAWATVAARQLDNRRFGPDPQRVFNWLAPHLAVLPDYISDRAGDFWTKAFMENADERGVAAARLDKESTIARADDMGIPRKEMAAFLAIEVAIKRIALKDGVVTLPSGHTVWAGRSAQKQQHGSLARRDDSRQQIFDLVEDVVGRRQDGRASHADPLQAFGERLGPLGHKNFGLWWTQIRAEWKRSDPETAPVSTLVLSAALVEGCLTFVVHHARGQAGNVFGSRTFEGQANTWKLEDLINGAAMGPNAILDNTTKQRADTLVKTRQRIHAGRLLTEFTQQIPDLRPEQARDAKDTAERVVRAVLDWLVSHPAPSP